MSRSPRVAVALLPLSLLLVLSTGGPALAGLIYEWVSVEAFDRDGDVDRALVTGRIELRDDIGLGDLVTAGDIESFSFDDSTFDFWDETFLQDGAAIAKRSGLGRGTATTPKKKIPRDPKDPKSTTKNLSQASLTLAALLDEDGNPIDPLDPTKKPRVDKASLVLQSPGRVKKLVKDVLVDSLVPPGADPWSWTTTLGPDVELGGLGYWRLDPSSAPAPEPAVGLLLAGALAGAHRARRRWRRKG